MTVYPQFSLQTKNDIFYAVFRTDENGKSKQKWLSTKVKDDGRHKKEAQRVAAELVVNYVNSKSMCTDDFCEWTKKWLAKKQKEVDPVTYEGYYSYFVNHIEPWFKGHILQKLTRDDLQTYYDEKQQTLSPKSIRDHHIVINGALKYAIKEGLIRDNPAEYVILPKKKKFVGEYYTNDQVTKLLKSIEKSNIADIVYLTVFYGLRRSEVVGLKWSGVNMSAHTFEIKTTVVRMYGTYEKNVTKNQSSNRTYPMNDEAYRMFCKIQREQDKNRLMFGKCYQESEYVFTWPDGHRVSPDYVTKTFSKLLLQNDLPHIRFHDLRHTTASLLIAAGFNLKDIQEWLGHSDISTTANIYGHLDFARKKQASQMLEKVLEANSP